MPMNFPDFQSLKDRAKVRGFRQPNEGETEESYRQSLARHMDNIDMVEANEIRNKVGWDQWTDGQKMVTFLDAMMAGGPYEERVFEDGKPCGHPGCAAHQSHPCECCGRIGAKGERVDSLI